MKLHPESLLRIPLVAQALEDPCVRTVSRAIDRHWKYEKLIPISVAGFNPLYSEMYYAKKSALADWLKAPRGSARPHNFGDRLVYELLFLVHDYLHCWGYLAIRELCPELGFGTARITKKNVEAFAFCHLLTEAIATVGVDYWYACAVDLNDVVPIGTAQRGLTVSYDERALDEFRRFAPQFTVQEPTFFGELARFYCDGEFHGFDAGALRNSALTLQWLRHELNYGEKQRAYIREWLAYLSGGAVQFGKSQLAAPVPIGARWQRRLIGELGELLWDKVKNDATYRFSPNAALPRAEVWRPDAERPLDYRFVNVNRVDDARLRTMSETGLTSENFDYLFHQYVSRYDAHATDPELLALLPSLRQSRNVDMLCWAFRGQKRVASAGEEPFSLFILN